MHLRPNGDNDWASIRFSNENERYYLAPVMGFLETIRAFAVDQRRNAIGKSLGTMLRHYHRDYFGITHRKLSEMAGELMFLQSKPELKPEARAVFAQTYSDIEGYFVERAEVALAKSEAKASEQTSKILV